MKKLLLFFYLVLVVTISGCVSFINTEADSSYLDFKELDKLNHLYIKKKDKIPYTGRIKEFDQDGNLKTEGYTVDGIVHGLFTAYHTNGNISYEVNIDNGKMNGLRKEYEENGALYSETHYINDQKDGLETIYSLTDIDGTRNLLSYKKEYKNGKLNGWYISYTSDDDGNPMKLFRIHYVDDVQHGQAKRYLSGKVVVEGNMVDGKQDGEWRSYFSGTNIIRQRMNFTLDLLDGPTVEYYENGKVKLESFYVMESKEGLWKEYHSNGRIYLEYKFKKNILDGDYKVYDYEGMLNEWLVYKAGEVVDEKTRGQIKQLTKN